MKKLRKGETFVAKTFYATGKSPGRGDIFIEK